jgi:hypothetical protein
MTTEGVPQSINQSDASQGNAQAMLVNDGSWLTMILGRKLGSSVRVTFLVKMEGRPRGLTTLVASRPITGLVVQKRHGGCFQTG